MKVCSVQEAERSNDIDIKLVSVRASKFRVFGSTDRIAISELAVVDLRGEVKPVDFDSKYKILDRHPMLQVYLVRKTSV